MQGQVDAGRGLAGPGDGHQDHVGIVVVDGDAVVMGQREIHRVDAAVVGLEVHHAVRLADPGMPVDGQFPLQRLDEGREHIQHQSAALGQDDAQPAVHAGTDHDGPDLVPLARCTDPFTGFARFFRIIDERHPVGDEAEPGELGQEAMPNGFSGDTGSIGHVEHRSDRRHTAFTPSEA